MTLRTSPSWKARPLHPRDELVLGERVKVRLVLPAPAVGAQDVVGEVAYQGPVSYAPAFEVWVGIVFPDRLGNCDGCVDGVRYFQCRPSHGLLVPMSKVMSVEARAYSALSPTLFTPIAPPSPWDVGTAGMWRGSPTMPSRRSSTHASSSDGRWSGRWNTVPSSGELDASPPPARGTRAPSVPPPASTGEEALPPKHFDHHAFVSDLFKAGVIVDTPTGPGSQADLLAVVEHTLPLYMDIAERVLYVSPLPTPQGSPRAEEIELLQTQREEAEKARDASVHALRSITVEKIALEAELAAIRRQLQDMETLLDSADKKNKDQAQQIFDLTANPEEDTGAGVGAFN